MFKIEEEERKLEAAIEETKIQYAEVTAELKELEIKSCHFKELEKRFDLLPFLVTNSEYYNIFPGFTLRLLSYSFSAVTNIFYPCTSGIGMSSTIFSFSWFLIRFVYVSYLCHFLVPFEELIFFLINIECFGLYIPFLWWELWTDFGSFACIETGKAVWALCSLFFVFFLFCIDETTYIIIAFQWRLKITMNMSLCK